jgi:RNA polymerase sigma-70 factor (ECF subfamily)
MDTLAATPPAAVVATPPQPRHTTNGGVATAPAGYNQAVNGRSGDTEVARRLVAGDDAALREVYRAHAAAVFGLAKRIVGNPTVAEDVTQEVFVRLWERPERYDPDRAPLRSYLLTTTHSRAVERLRAEASRRRRHEIAARGSTVVIRDDAADALTVDVVRDAVRDALAQLTEAQRVPIEMAYFDGLSYRDVAAKLGEPEGTVKYRIRTGMQRLRAALRAAEVTP